MTEPSDTHEMDLTLKLLESGHAKLKVGPDGLELKVAPVLPTGLVGDVVRSRLNASIIARGFGPKGPRPDPYDELGVRYTPRPGQRVMAAFPEPIEVPVEGAHRVAECPECVQGKHGNCDGSAWCRAHDALELCPCAQADHQ